MSSEDERTTQTPGPEDASLPIADRDPANPTATAPDSVPGSVGEQAEYAGKQGRDAADPPLAAAKSDGAGPVGARADFDSAPDVSRESADPGDYDPGSDLDSDEGADVMETQQEARRNKDAREDQEDEDLINLDTGD